MPESDSNAVYTFSLSYLRTALAVAESGSFRSAANCLDVGQSVVSRRMQRLEDELGVSLFERSSSGTSLPLAGERFVGSSRTVLQQVRTAFADARSAGVAATGRLRIGLIASLSEGVFRGIVEMFAKQHSDVELSFFEGDRSDLFMRLSHRRVDAVFACGEPREGDADTLLVAEERIYLAPPAKSSKTGVNCLSWNDLASETSLVGTDEFGSAMQAIILRNTSDVGCKIAMRCMDLGREGIMALVGLGFGISVAADHWRGVRYPNVSFVPVGDIDGTVPFSLWWRPENDNPALRRFLSLARIHARRAFSSS